MKIPLKEWIKGTKVVDKDGNPLVLYHGTNGKFSTFVESDFTLVPGTLRGFYFTSSKDAAQEYGKYLMVVMVNLKNPFIGDPTSEYRRVHNIPIPDFGSPPEAFALSKTVTRVVVKDWLIQSGYDGVIIPSHTRYFDHDEIIAFSNDQIRIIKVLEQALEKSTGFEP